MNQKDSFQWRDYAACIVSHVFWGFSFFASRMALNTASVFVLLSHRFLIAFLLMSLPAIKLVDFHIKGKPFVLLLLLGLAEPVIYFFGEQYGILHSNTVFSGVMIATIPIVCTLAAVPTLGEQVSPVQILCSLLSVGGVIGIGLLQSNSGALDAIGVVALVIAVLSAAAYTLIGRRISGEFTAFERTYMMIMEGAVVFTLIAAIQCGGSLTAYLEPLRLPSYLWSILYLSVCCSVVAYFLSAYTIGRMSVARQTVFANLTTAVSVFAGAVFLHEPFSGLSLIFAVLILVGIYGVQVGAAKARGIKSKAPEKQ